jgi:hypothetical protein
MKTCSARGAAKARLGTRAAKASVLSMVELGKRDGRG